MMEAEDEILDASADPIETETAVEEVDPFETNVGKEIELEHLTTE